MIAAVQRWIARDFAPNAEQISERDKSMFENYQWLRRQHPTRRKVIVWSATVHIAKRPDTPASGNFGSYVHRMEGAHVFSLGFSALTGSYRQGRRDVHPLPLAPPDSLEALSLQNTPASAAYLGPARLAKVGSAPAAAFRHTYETLHWADFLDGIVIFRIEYPPVSTRE